MTVERYLYICIYFIQCFMNVILTYDFICIAIMLLSLEMPLCCFKSSYEHYLYPCVLCTSVLLLSMLCIYLCMYWNSGASDLLVLMLFVLQCTDRKYNFLTKRHDECKWLHIRVSFVGTRNNTNCITITSMPLKADNKDSWRIEYLILGIMPVKQ